MTREGQAPRLERRGRGAIVRAFTDLKRHNLTDEDYETILGIPMPGRAAYIGASVQW